MPGLHFRGGWRGSNYLVSLGSKRMIILRDDQFYRYHAQKPIITDILVISNGLSFKPQRIVQELMPSVVILDSSMKGSRAGQWMKTLRKEGIRCHSVIENGAYVAHALPDNYR